VDARQGASDPVTLYALYAGVAVPILYFGTQLIAAPFYPGYSFLTNDASTLGSSGSAAPAVFNGGAIATGVAMLVGSWGFIRTFQKLGVHLVLTWLTMLTIISGAIGSINAGMHPLPDPRHASGLLSTLGSGILFLPLLLPVAVWRIEALHNLRRYLVWNLVVVFCLIPIMIGLVQRLSLMAGVQIPGLSSLVNEYQGVLQRIAALVVFGPIGVSAAFLVRLARGSPKRTLPSPSTARVG
jgi:hypothetical protein